MSKLPTEFVQAPATRTKQPRARRPRKASLISPEPVRDPRELLLHLTEAEHQALEDARQQLQQSGVTITLDQMLHRVLADWVAQVHAAATRAPAREEPAVVRVRDVLADRLRRWRAVASGLWRTYAQRA